MTERPPIMSLVRNYTDQLDCCRRGGSVHDINLVLQNLSPKDRRTLAMFKPLNLQATCRRYKNPTQCGCINFEPAGKHVKCTATISPLMAASGLARTAGFHDTNYIQLVQLPSYCVLSRTLYTCITAGHQRGRFCNRANQIPAAAPTTEEQCAGLCALAFHPEPHKPHRTPPSSLPVSSQLRFRRRFAGRISSSPGSPFLQSRQCSLALGVEKFPDVFLLGRSRPTPQRSLEASLGLRQIPQLQRHEAAAVVISWAAGIYLERGVEVSLFFFHTWTRRDVNQGGA